MSVYEDIIKGLEEAIEHEQGKRLCTVKKLSEENIETLVSKIICDNSGTWYLCPTCKKRYADDGDAFFCCFPEDD